MSTRPTQRRPAVAKRTFARHPERLSTSVHVHLVAGLPTRHAPRMDDREFAIGVHHLEPLPMPRHRLQTVRLSIL
jgi:hypothetical protein